jgi:hypothetical protein
LAAESGGKAARILPGLRRYIQYVKWP